jgi:ABC-type branched-subunit amino acid transport system ATPase component/ABC-type branched-subunit amino acid transport system permease subunit
MTIPLLGWTVGASIVTIGLLTGLAYSILAVGIVLIYRSNKAINFAHGEIGAFGSALLAKMVLDWHTPYWLALPVVVAVGAALGAAIDLAVVRRLFRAPRRVLLVATIGVAQVVFLGRLLLPDIKNVQPYPSPLNRQFEVGGVLLGSPQLMLLAFVPAVIAGLALFLNRTAFGVAIRASADNQDRAQLAGIPIKRVSTVVWAIAGGLAVLTVVLLDPLQSALVGFASPSVGPSLLLRALAVALVGRMVSLSWALVGGMAIGVLEAIVLANAGNPGLVDAVLFVVVVLLVLRQGSSSDDRVGGFSLGPRVRPVPPAAAALWQVRHLSRIGFGGLVLAAAALPLVVTAPSHSYLFSRVAIFAMIGLSVTVLTGWAGQLSLGQFAFVGVGALTATSLVARGMNFPAAAAYAAVAGAVCAIVVGFPALRTRGPFLALTTLAFAVGAQSWLYTQPIFGTEAIFNLPRTTIFGFLDLRIQRNFYWLCLLLTVFVGLAVAQLRRTGIGRTIIAARDNPAAASSFTVSPTIATLSAFVFSGAIAGLAGALYAGVMSTFTLSGGSSPPVFGPGESLSLIAMVVIGGLGSIPGAVLGALYVVGLPAIFGSSPEVTVATSGIGLLLLLLFLPGGLAQGVYRLRDIVVKIALSGRDELQAQRVPAGDAKLPARATRPPAVAAAVAEGAMPAQVSRELVLEATDIAVEFSGRRVLNGANLQVQHGEIVGLIGSNGAGKSTLMNVVSGFVQPTSGALSYRGQDITGLAPHQRARLGMGRVFQDARLFSELTLRDTVRVALEAHERSEFLPSLLALPPSRRSERRKRAQADAYIDFLGLGRYADTFAGELSTGTRRILEMCCLLAQGADLLLLDEPTAGVAQRETEAFGPLIERIRAELQATVVIIEHDFPLIMSISHRVYCYAAGALISEGAPEEVRNDPSVVAAYLGTDQRAIDRSDTRPAGHVSAAAPAAKAPGAATRRSRTTSRSTVRIPPRPATDTEVQTP